ncbi:MAG: hypothetical protein Q7W30_06400 [Coriobacteriia bacterium]|nr:hypothetical protein [Coriobacteriia bacterium]
MSSRHPRDQRPFARFAIPMALASALLVMCSVAPAFALTYDPLNVISYDTWRGSSSMSAADIQAFLDTRPGPLKSLVTTDYVGVKRSAATIIYEAARLNNLNPKVIIATLDKEQSLISEAPHVPHAGNSHGTYTYHIPKAMGCGIYKGSKNTYPGFGKQVFYGAQKLSTYEISFGWYPGKTKSVYSYPDGHRITIAPKNACTFALYTYTPYYPQVSFWNIYVRYFGDPQQPARMRNVYGFINRSNGSIRYTSSETERYQLIKRGARAYRYTGVAFTVDTSATANSTPLYRLYDPRRARWAYTLSAKTRLSLLATHVWRSSGSVAKVSTGATGTPIYKLENRRTHATLYTASAATKQKLCYGRAATHYYRGVAFRFEKSIDTTVPIGPTTKP